MKCALLVSVVFWYPLRHLASHFAWIRPFTNHHLTKASNTRGFVPSAAIAVVSVEVPDEMVGRIIGKAGANIKSFQERSGAHINVDTVRTVRIEAIQCGGFTTFTLLISTQSSRHADSLEISCLFSCLSCYPLLVNRNASLGELCAAFKFEVFLIKWFNAIP